MVISRASECAVRALLYMAGFPNDEVVSKQDICRTQEITPGFFIKIMQPLLSAKLVRSYRGVKGGFSLAKPKESINLWDIISIVDGPIYLNKCLIRDGYCLRDKTCPVHCVWHDARESLEQILRKATLDRLAKEVKKKG